MQTSVACPKCHRSFDVPPELMGKRLRCLQCQHVFAAQADPPPPTALRTAPVPVRPLSESPPDEEPPPPRVELRIRRSDHGVPTYLWSLAALPWGLLLLAMGGCVWGLLAGLAAAGLSAVGIALVQARQWPVAARLAGLLVLDGVAGLLLIVFGVLLWIVLPSDPRSQPTPMGAAQAPPQAAPAAPLLLPAPEVPLPPVHRLFTEGQRVYLADLPEFGVQAGPWPFDKHGRVGDGRPIQVHGVRSPKGLGMHPPEAPAFASVRYRLGKQAARLRAVVAINDTTKWCWSPAIFTVLGDGKPLWNSVMIAHNHTHSQECSVDISGVDVLELRVHCINGNAGVHAVWVQPRLLQTADTPDP